MERIPEARYDPNLDDGIPLIKTNHLVLKPDSVPSWERNPFEAILKNKNSSKTTGTPELKVEFKFCFCCLF